MQGSHSGGSDARAEASGCPAHNNNKPKVVPHGADPAVIKSSQDWLQDAPKEGLSNIAVASTIPKSGSDDTWHYPSPQRFYNAMRRKGWDTEEKDVPYVVSIHNTINERCWAGVMEYEKFHEHECPASKLLRFRGRPQDFSPKARLRHFVGYALPFDRHDWIVDRCGKEVKYVLDYYQGKPDPNLPASIFLDIRPALTFEGAIDRIRMQFKRWTEKKEGHPSPSSHIALPPGYDPTVMSKHHGSGTYDASKHYNQQMHAKAANPHQQNGGGDPPSQCPVSHK